MNTLYPVMTSQNAFTSMKGHVAHGSIIRMNSGDTLEIIASSRKGYTWDIYNRLDHKSPIYSAVSAMDVECFIVNYQG